MWWRSYVECRPVGSPPLTWNQFYQVFLESYIPCTLRESRRDEFNDLEHRGMPVAEYEARFNFSAHYAVKQIPAETERVRRFIRGLVLPLKLATLQLMVMGSLFQSVVNHATEVESAKIRAHGGGSNKRIRQFGSFSGSTSRCGGQSGRINQHYFGHPIQSALQISAGWSGVVLSVVTQGTSLESIPDLDRVEPSRVPGHVMSKDSIIVDPKKIEAVRDWARPNSVIEIRSFMGLWSYYRRCVKGFSSISTYLTSLTQKDVPFQWSDECEANVVADMLSRKAMSMSSLARLIIGEHPLAMEVQCFANSMIRDKVLSEEVKEAILDEVGVLRIKGHICVPRVGGLIQLILEEAYSSRYSIHPGAKKIYCDLRQYYCCHSSIDIASFEALYGRTCRSMISCFDAFEVRPWGTDLLRGSLDKVKLIQEKLFASQSRQKEFADRKFQDLKFMVGDQVLLKVSPLKGVM
ncbi:uncharacterized protein LOC132039492 [Lycium ferocissimum]|uniref:uncharacterized protein LOC132039492 n=1 Tax=Lycium ferocissimum TaxID=112874 RepID=UPI0028159449|nr:uncharacterized protein LOC132039492 [Lycium ferocissimum]